MSISIDPCLSAREHVHGGIVGNQERTRIEDDDAIANVAGDHGDAVERAAGDAERLGGPVATARVTAICGDVSITIVSAPGFVAVNAAINALMSVSTFAADVPAGGSTAPHS